MISFSSASKSKQIIGSYQLGYTIGQGTFGKVKVARHLLTNQNVAIKIFEKQKIQKDGELKRVLLEIKIMKDLKHPNIVQMYEIIQTPEKIYIVMQFVEKGELFTYIKLNKKIQQKTAAKMFFQLISAIQYLQKNNITHRDIKPQNILINQKFTIKIADFGLSNYFEENKKLETSCGSPCYALPQMLIGQSYDPKSADIWSCGIVLFTMTCGYLPFQQCDVVSLYKKIVKQSLDFIPDLSIQLRDLINNILHKDIKKRYTIQQIKYHKWLVKYCKVNYNIQQKIKNVTQNRFQFKNQLLNELQLYGVQSNYAKYCLDINKHNFVTSLYYLLKKKSQRQPNFKFVTSQSTCLSIKTKIFQSEQNEQYQSSIQNIDINKIQESEHNSNIQQIQQNKKNKRNSKSKKKKNTKIKNNSNSIHLKDKKIISTQKSKRSTITENSQKKQGKQKEQIKPRKSKQQTDQYYLGNNNKKSTKKKTSIYQILDPETKIVCKQYEQNYEARNKRLSKHIRDEI